MLDPRAHYSAYEISVNGSPVGEASLDKTMQVKIEQNLHLPDALTLVFRDVSSNLTTEPLNLALANANQFPIGADIEVKMGRNATPASVFKGEITAEELDIDADAAPRYIVRALARSHRLQRGRKSRSFLNMTDSDIASRIAGEAGLQCTAESTTIVYDYLAQNNQTDWEFLATRARRIGYDLYVDGTTLTFTKPKTTGSAAFEATLWQNTLRLHVRMTSIGQVDKVTVQSWDPEQKQPIVGMTSTGAATTNIGAAPTGAALAGRFNGGTMVLSNHVPRTQEDATKIAQAASDVLEASIMQADVTLIGDPTIRPGVMGTLAGLGDRFSGAYYVTSATHLVGANQPYETTFTVSGRRSDTLGEMMTQASTKAHGGSQAVAIALVTNNRDEKNQGRVKVKFPWLNDIESAWVRVAAPGGGNKRGVYWLPEVNDEVLVAFEQGDTTQGYIIGGLWNGIDEPPSGNDTAVSEDGKVNLRIFQSRTGHIFTMDDTDGKQKVTLFTQGGHKVTLDDGEKPQISIIDKTESNKIIIDSTDNQITVQAVGNIQVKSDQDVTISGMNISMNAEANISMKANANVSLEATAQAEFKGTMVSVESQSTTMVKGTMTQIQGEAMVQVQGALVQIN